MLSREVMIKGLMRLSVIFKSTEGLSELFYNTYYSAVSTLSNDAFNRAVQYLINNHKDGFMPKPSDVFQAVSDSSPIPEYTPKDRQIEVTYPGIPPEVKKQMQETLEKIKKRAIK